MRFYTVQGRNRSIGFWVDVKIRARQRWQGRTAETAASHANSELTTHRLGKSTILLGSVGTQVPR